jgi:pyrimidine operon attenuation protein/uracil phosphoribosyltransferase
MLRGAARQPAISAAVDVAADLHLIQCDEGGGLFLCPLEDERMSDRRARGAGQPEALTTPSAARADAPEAGDATSGGASLWPDTDRLILTADEMRRAISRIAHEILERNGGADELVLVGLRTRGVPLAERLSAKIGALEQVAVPACPLDTRPYRDDVPRRGRSRPASLPVVVAGRVVVLVDDVLFTGRTARAALDALLDHGRPRKVQLAVLVDRGHRELPIRADYVGKNVPTALSEIIRVRLVETDGSDAVLLRHPSGAA